MKGCSKCPAHDKCTVTYRGSSCQVIRWSYGIDSDPEIVTNGDKIRSMTDEDLAGFLEHGNLCVLLLHNRTWCEEHGSCDGCLEEWLKQPAEVE